MNWIVGLDLRPHGEGAIQFASWLAGAARAAGGEGFFPLHVLEDEHMRMVLRYHHLDEVTEGARGAARKALAPLAAAGAAAEAEVVQALRAEDGLVGACRARKADGVVIGRAGKREGGGLVRLGRVARGVLRALPAPVIVVPPDLTFAEVGSGPVIALTQLREASPACDFARAIAARTGRPLAILHVVPEQEHGAYLPIATHERVAKDRLQAAQAALATWASARGVKPELALVATGGVVERAVAVAVEQRSPLLVVGSHRATTSEAILTSILGRELAAAAPMAVAVVPPRG